MLPYLIAGAIGFGIGKLFEEGGETFMAGGMTNEDILRSFLTSERETQTNNLATFYSTLGGVMLLRNYGTLIAVRMGRRVKITDVKHSKTTSAITNRLKALAEEMGYSVFYVSEFEEGGEAGMIHYYIGGLVSEDIPFVYKGEEEDINYEVGFHEGGIDLETFKETPSGYYVRIMPYGSTNIRRFVYPEKDIEIAYLSELRAITMLLFEADKDTKENQKIAIKEGKKNLPKLLKYMSENLEEEDKFSENVRKVQDDMWGGDEDEDEDEYAGGGKTYMAGGRAGKNYYWITMDRNKIDEYIGYASRMYGMFEGQIYTQAPNKVAFDSQNDMFAFTSMIDNHNNDNDFQEGDEGYIHYEELFNGEPRPNIFDRIIGGKYTGGGEINWNGEDFDYWYSVATEDSNESKKELNKLSKKDSVDYDDVTELALSVRDDINDIGDFYDYDEDEWVDNDAMQMCYAIAEKMLEQAGVKVKYAGGGEAGEKYILRRGTPIRKNIRKKRPKTREPKMVRTIFEEEYFKDFDNGGEAGKTSNLSSVKRKYLKNENENAHSENVVLLAENFGDSEDLKLAKEILKLHNTEGHLSTENGKKRQELHLKLIKIARKKFGQEGIEFANGGEAKKRRRSASIQYGRSDTAVDKTRVGKPVGYRFSNAKANQLRKDPYAKPTEAQVKKYLGKGIYKENRKNRSDRDRNAKI